MFTLDDMMNINDNFLFNFDYSGYGLGYKPTKYNMVGGYLVEKDPERIQELMNGDDNDMSKVLRAYERAKDEIINGKEYDDEEERHQDLQDIQKNILSIERKIERKLKEEPESNIVSEEEEIKEQLEYYEENLKNLSDQEYEEYMGLLAYLHEKELDEKEKDKILDRIKVIVDFWDELREEKHEEYREIEDEEEDNEDIDYENIFFTNIEKNIIKVIKEFNLNIKEKNILIGNEIEKQLINFPELFKTINDNMIGKVFNSSDDKSLYYTKEFLEYNSKNGINSITKKTKMDYYLTDFITENTLYELKSLSKSYKDYKKIGTINLVSNKITGNNGEYKPIYTEDRKVKNIICDTKYKTFNTLKNENMDYKIIFMLKDGLYYYEPLKDDKFILTKNPNGTYSGKLNYTQFYGDYNIDINKLKKISKKKYNNIFKI